MMTEIIDALQHSPTWRGTLPMLTIFALRREGYSVRVLGGGSDAWDCEVW